MSQQLFIANWKTKSDVSQSIDLARQYVDQGIASRAREANPDRTVIIAPTPLALANVTERIKNTGLLAASQDCSVFAKPGSYTGETTVDQLQKLETHAVLVGHSERRNLLGETYEQVQKKVVNVMGAGLLTVLCIEETEKERAEGNTIPILEYQLETALEHIEQIESLSMEKLPLHLAIAYEPAWAISSASDHAHAPTAEQVNEVALAISDWLQARFGESVGSEVPILYGGSVDGDNVGTFMSIDEISGCLVGSASLDAEEFARIVCV